MVRRQYVEIAFLSIIVLETFCPCSCQFLNGPLRNPADTIKNFVNIPTIPRFLGNGPNGNAQNDEYFPTRNLHFQRRQFNQRPFDRRDADSSDNDAGANGAMSQFPNTGFCKDGWTEASLNGVEICIRVNIDPSSWEDAQEKCRQDYSFLLKMEVPITVQSKSVQDYLLALGIKNIWTGLHSEHKRLVWDDITPNLVNGGTKYLPTPWNWDKNFTYEEQFCGELDIQDKSHAIETKGFIRSIGNRNRRSPSDQNQMQQFGFFPQNPALPTPSSKENVDNTFKSIQKDFSQLSFEDRFKAITNVQKMMNSANNARQPHNINTNLAQQRRLFRQQFPDMGFSNSYGNQQQNMYSNVKPVQNQRFLQLLNMFRSGTNEHRPDNMNINMNTASQNFGMEIGTTVAPSDDNDKNKEKLSGYLDLINKQKQSDDDDNKNKIENIQQELLTTTGFDSNNEVKLKTGPTMNPLFANLNKELLSETNIAELNKESNPQSVDRLLEKVLKPGNEEKKNKFGKDISDNKVPEIDNSQIKKLEKVIDKLDDIQNDPKKVSESKEDRSTENKGTVGLVIDNIPASQNVERMGKIGVALKPTGIPNNMDVSRNFNVYQHKDDHDRREDESTHLPSAIPETEDTVNIKNDKSKSMENVAIDAAIAEIDALLNDEITTNVSPVKKEQVDGDLGNLASLSVKPTESSVVKETVAQAPDIQSDGLLKILEGIEKIQDDNGNVEKSIDELRQKLQINLQTNDNLDQEPKTIDNPKLENNQLNAGLMIHNFNPTESVVKNDKDSVKNNDDIEPINLDESLIKEQTGVQKLLKNLFQMSERKPEITIEDDFMPGRIVQSVISNEVGGTTIGIIPTSNKPTVVLVDPSTSYTPEIFNEDSSDSQTEEQRVPIVKEDDIKQSDNLNTASVVLNDDSIGAIIENEKNADSPPPVSEIASPMVTIITGTSEENNEPTEIKTPVINPSVEVPNMVPVNDEELVQPDAVVVPRDDQQQSLEPDKTLEIKGTNNKPERNIVTADETSEEDVGNSETTQISTTTNSMTVSTFPKSTKPQTTVSDMNKAKDALVRHISTTIQKVMDQNNDHIDDAASANGDESTKVDKSVSEEETGNVPSNDDGSDVSTITILNPTLRAKNDDKADIFEEVVDKITDATEDLKVLSTLTPDVSSISNDAVAPSKTEEINTSGFVKPNYHQTTEPVIDVSGEIHDDEDYTKKVGTLSRFIDDNLPVPDESILRNILDNVNFIAEDNMKNNKTSLENFKHHEDKDASNEESDIKEEVVDYNSDIPIVKPLDIPTTDSTKEHVDDIEENISIGDLVRSTDEPRNVEDATLISIQGNAIIKPFIDDTKSSEENSLEVEFPSANNASMSDIVEEPSIKNIQLSEEVNDVIDSSSSEEARLEGGIEEEANMSISAPKKIDKLSNAVGASVSDTMEEPSNGEDEQFSEEVNDIVETSAIVENRFDDAGDGDVVEEANVNVNTLETTDELSDGNSASIGDIVEEASIGEDKQFSEEMNDIVQTPVIAKDSFEDVSDAGDVKGVANVNANTLGKVDENSASVGDMMVEPSIVLDEQFSEEVNDILESSAKKSTELNEAIGDVLEETNEAEAVVFNDKDVDATNIHSDENLSEELTDIVNFSTQTDDGTRMETIGGINSSEKDNSSSEEVNIISSHDKISNVSEDNMLDDSTEEQNNDTFSYRDNFDVEVDEHENTAKEILSSEEIYDEINASDAIINDISDAIANNADSYSTDSIENITDIYDTGDDILVSEAAAQDDTVHLTELRDLEGTKTADDMLDEFEEFVPPEDIVEHIPPSPTTPTPDQKTLIMHLGGCETPKPFVCYTQPVKVDTEVSSCGNGWYGNVFVDKCYRYISQPITYTYAENMCRQEGGQLAIADTNFLRKFILTSVTLARLKSNIQNSIVNVWIHSETVSSNCRLLNNLGIQNVNCLTVAEAVCERPKQKISPQISLTDNDSSEHDIEFVQPEIKQFPITNPENKLECPLTNDFAELPIIWYKDGIPLAPKITKTSDSILFPSLKQIPVSLTTDLHLTSALIPFISAFSSNDTLEILQGKYWCEVWTTSSFRRHESKPTLVRYSDVIAFVGTIDIHPMSLYDITMYNMILEPSQVIADMIKDLQVIYESTVPDIRAVVPEVSKIKVFPNSVESGSSQKLKFYTYVTMTTPYTMATERSVNLLMSRELRESLQNTSFVLSLPGKTPIHLVRSIKFFSTVACPMSRLKDEDTKLIATFPGSATGLEVNSVETCDGEVAGRAKCEGDFESGAYWTNIRVFKTCGDDKISGDTDSHEDDDPTVLEQSSVKERLKELAEADIEDDNVDNVMEETTEIIETADEITAEYVDYVADIVDKTAETSRATQETSENIVKTVDRLLNVKDDEIKKTKKANSIIKNLEKVAEKMDLDVYGQFRIVTPNVALEVWDLKHQAQPVIGLAAKEDQKDVFQDSHIITLYNRSQIFVDDVNAAIELPPNLVDEVMSGPKPRLYMMVYRHGRLFQTMSEAQTSLQQNEEARFVDDSGMLNSFVISASIGGKKIEHLDQHVKAIFKPLKDVGNKEKTCAHWDFTLNNNRGGWSARGCTYNGTMNGRDVCLCNHLTNFAVLIDFYGQAEPIPEDHEISLSIISLIGLSLSILGLSLTIISYAFFKKLRRGRAQQTLFNLALSMLCSWIVFLTGIKQTHSYYGCIIVAALLHYFILASFMWMLMEAFLQYLTFVKVLGTYVTRYTLKTVIIAWGLPLIPVISVSSIDYRLYSGGSRYCWMSLTAFYYSFAIPVGVIILSNLIVFVITVISIFRRPTGLRTNQSKSKMAMANLQAAITSFVLLGLTWFLGYLAISDARLPFQYAFTILNSLQGFFIFVLFVIRKKRVRDQWLILCCCKTQEQEKALRSLSASGSIPSTGSGRSSYSGRSERSDSTKTTTSFVNDSYDSLFFPFKSSRSTLYYREKSNSVSSE